MKKTAIITGASGGIGLELAWVLAREGHNLLITARSEDRLVQLKKELEAKFNIEVLTFAIDLTETNAAKKLYDFTQENSLAVHILINNAGVGDYGFFHESEWDRQAAIIDLNVKTLTHLTHLFLPSMIKMDRAYVMNVASTAAFQPGPLMSVYYASKSYVVAFGEAIANELSDTAVTVTTLCPGPTKTNFQKSARMKKSKLLDRVPVTPSRKVAEYGYNSMMKGKRIAIFGFINKILPHIIGVLPRKFVTSAVRFIQERK